MAVENELVPGVLVWMDGGVGGGVVYGLLIPG
jgi:hypothetical protein